VPKKRFKTEMLKMSLDLKDVRPKIRSAAHERLVTTAIARGQNINVLAGELLERALLGDGYKEILAAEQMVRLGIVGRSGE
jgi:hypothetical protein